MRYTVCVPILAMLFGIAPTLHAGDAIIVRSGTRKALVAFLDGNPVPRPEPGPCTVSTPHFIIHYDTIGEHATTRAYAESVSVYAEHCWQIQVDSLGWIEPPSDSGRGGDDRYDIYIRNTGADFCNTESSLVPGVDASFFVIRRSSEDWNALRAAVANEFNAALDLAAGPVLVSRLLE